MQEVRSRVAAVVLGCAAIGLALHAVAAATEWSSGSPTASAAAFGVAQVAASATTTFATEPIAGRPTGSSVTLNAIPSSTTPYYYEYGTVAGALASRTASTTPAAAGAPIETLISGLQPNTRYYYRLRASDYVGTTHTFATQRSADATFTFEVQGDSHPERVNSQFNAGLYDKTLANAGADRPDFYVATGDDFSVDQMDPATITSGAVEALYASQRTHLWRTESPVFLVNGNHEQASVANLDGTPDNVAVWGQNARNRYYPQPAPDAFYSGDTTQVAFIGKLRDYYAFKWGDALFVVIDPYWHSSVVVDNPFGAPKDPNRDPWDITLGNEQYQWFKDTLENSDAKYKFVFAHHVLGTGRGGIELAGTYEWGNAAMLPTKRPGWTKTIHQLMADNHVTVFFQGHDHIYAKQQLDGVIYQTLPEPADPNYSLFNDAAFLTGEKLPNSGRLRVTVSPAQTKVEYVRSYLEKADEVAASYDVTSSVGTEPPPPAFSANEILGRPTASSITVGSVPNTSAPVYFDYGTSAAAMTAHTAAKAVASGTATETLIAGLQANTRYYYRAHSGAVTGATHSFMTRRAEGSSYRFTIDADPHNGEAGFNGDVFSTTMRNALADQPDFNLDLGDTFMTEKIGASSYAEAEKHYTTMRPYFRILAADAPLFLVNGNHEAELGWLFSNPATAQLPIWTWQLRQSYFPSPVPGGFYSGATSTDPILGVKRDGYYAWTWGDALYVVLDPFWYTTTKPVTSSPDSSWNWTLGKEQYDWLAATLRSSDARYKFVFLHNLVGGNPEARGGVEVARFYEWGGKNTDGTDGFAAHRPGWDKPIHDLLVENRVSAVFHGHDHVFVRQMLDGIVYQECPQPSNAQYNNARLATDYGYLSGDVVSSSGHLRVSITPQAATIDYVRAYLPASESTTRTNGDIGFSYQIAPAADTVTATIDSAAPSPVTQGYPVAFSGHLLADSFNHAAAGYAWRSSIDGALSTSASFSTTALSAGTHTIYFKVRCADGAWSPEVSTTVVVEPGPTFTISSSAGVGGSISPTGTSVVAGGSDSATYTVTPNAGFHIVNVVVDGVSKGALSSYRFTGVSANHTISATFAWTKLRSYTSLRPNATSLRSGRYITLYAHLYGGTIPPGTVIRFEVMRPGSHHYDLLKTVAVSSSGYASYRYKVVAKGYRYHRVRFLGNWKYLPATVRAGTRLRVY